MSRDLPAADVRAPAEADAQPDAQAETAAKAGSRDITIALTPGQLVLVAVGAIVLLRLLRRWRERA